MYSFETRVRYSECNYKGEATPTAILDYLQDCCTFQSEDCGVGVEYLKKNHKAWVLSSWQVDIMQYPRLGEEIQISTMPYEIKGFYGLRNFQITNKEGEALVQANSIWVYVDTDTEKPVKVSEEMKVAYGIDMRLDMEYLGRKLPKLPEAEPLTPVSVGRFFLDTNRHMNNAKYIMVAEEYVPENFVVHRIWAEYKKSALLGNLLYPVVTASEKGVNVSLKGEGGEVYANIIFA